MTLLLAATIGYVIGSIPTANAIAGLVGVDLRRDGSRNPGANNARRLGGYGLASAVLAVEVLKGALAVAAGGVIAGDPGMALAGVAAVFGNVFNVWYGFAGGKGLGITLGVLVAAWPLVVVPCLVSIGLFAFATRSSGIAAIVTAGALTVAALLADPTWPAPWGISGDGELPWLAVGLLAVLTPRHMTDVRERAPSRP